MNHKRGRPKNRRAGCLLCKPHKMNGAGGLKDKIHKTGFGNVRKAKGTERDMVEHDA